MIEFMVLSAPRSASTWVSNWLTTDHTLCLHDPILEHDPDEFDRLESDRALGLACSGLALLPNWVNAHPARKVIVHRSAEAINASLLKIGLSPLTAAWNGALDRIRGLHVGFQDLFLSRAAAPIYEYLTHRLFDARRHKLLTRMHIDPEFDRLPVVPQRARGFRERIERALG